jgi:sigma-B regulation protein RsbU (phosphoserine phosphatase)
MMKSRRPWEEELAIIDRTMKAISGITDPEKLVQTYWTEIGQLLPINDYLSVSRRYLQRPFYRITRSSRFVEHHNPWTQRDRLPLLSGGFLEEIVYANRPVIIDDLPDRLKAEDPAWFYLQGFQRLIALPQYDDGEGVNISLMLLPPGVELDPHIIPTMHWHAGLFGRGTTNLVLRNELTTAMEALDRELKVVGNIQRSLLPQKLPEIPGFDIAADYVTSAQAGGDYYDFFPLADGAWGMFIADVSGHGTPAAVLMAITHALAHSQPGKHTPPDELLNYLNRQLARCYTRAGTFVTAFYAVLDPSKRSLTYARAGHNPPRLAHQGVLRGQIESLDQNGAMPLGILPDQTYRQTTVSLEHGDLLLLYTDGVTEARAPKRGVNMAELFGIERLDQLLLDCGSGNAQQCIESIRQEIGRFSQNTPIIDDQTLIALCCK